MACPNLPSSSPRSFSSCSTKADDDRDSATAMTTASSMLRMDASEGSACSTFTRNCVISPLPTGSAAAVKTAEQMTSWRTPMPNAYLARDWRWERGTGGERG